MKVALITGITGQDGSYLAEFLLEKGYEVHGTKVTDRAPARIPRSLSRALARIEVPISGNAELQLGTFSSFSAELGLRRSQASCTRCPLDY